jgi:vesicle transport protein SEC22
MVKLTMIARVSDGLPLAEGLEHFRELNNDSDFEFYKQKAKLLFNKLSLGEPGPSRMSLRIQPYCFHYIMEDGVCYITLCEQSYPRKLAFHYLEDLQREFGRLDRSKIETASKPYAFIKFDAVIQRIRKLYLDTRTQRNLSKLNNDEYKVQQIITRDISEVIGKDGNKNADDAETNLMLSNRVSPRLSNDIESAIKDSKVLEKVALKWMPAIILATVIWILIWARVVLWEVM